jgi:uncharacterized membrane protein
VAGKSLTDTVAARHRTAGAYLIRSAVPLISRLSVAQRIALIAATIFYVIAGSLHFTKPEFYLRIMPPYVAWHLAMVRASGFFEILGGVGLLVPPTRRAAARGLVALLIAVFPANLYMATNPVEAGAVSIAPFAAVGAFARSACTDLVGAVVHSAAFDVPLILDRDCIRCSHSAEDGKGGTSNRCT